MEIATLFESEKFESEEAVMPFGEIIPLVKTYLNDFCKANKIDYDGEKEVTYKSAKITFYLNYSPKIRRYFLCIIPKNIWQHSYKNVLLPAFNETVEFFKKLPSSLKIGEVNFSKSTITGNIDIGAWSFTTKPDVGEKSITAIQSFSGIKKIGASIYAKKIGSLRQNLLIVDKGGIINIQKRNWIKDKLAPLFSGSEIIQYDDSVLEHIEKRTDRDNLFVVFFGNKASIDECRGRYKQYFISKGIPSQFIHVENVEKISDWGFENLVFEILKKAQKEDSISLDTVTTMNADALLCLSDIGIFQNNKVFGISISFTGIGGTDDWLEVYNDVDYQTKFEEIRFQYGELTKLSNKIDALSNLQGKTIDVFVTKRWRTVDVGYLSRILEKSNITVRKFLYVGSKANRFLFSSLPNETDMLYIHPFIIWDDRVASIQSNSRIQLYGTMFPMYIELLNPWKEGKLTEEDLKMILWLVKKRIYRVANFYSLKLPEPLSLFDQVKKLGINDVSGRLRISLHTLI